VRQALELDDTFTRELPGDTRTDNSLRQARACARSVAACGARTLPSAEAPARLLQVSGAFYSFVTPTAAQGVPTLMAASTETAQLLGLDPAEFETAEFYRIFAGQAPLGKPWAQVYGGHQFGSWAGQLGDGRAISLCEVKNARGERWELQLKGAGLTPFSRRGACGSRAAHLRTR
jgi:uncharacterized protein YdiU (UPF0061 family)